MTDQPVGDLIIRTASKLVGVDYPHRTIELVVIPYDTETVVPYDGRPVMESVAPGAFDGIQRRANRIRVNRDHDIARTVGRAITLHPSREDGLVAELKIARTELGDDTLALADDDCLDASAAFRHMPGGASWSKGRSAVRLTKLWLEHIAMTPDPAYPTAQVLAVRHRDEPPVAGDPVLTPNLDLVKGWVLETRYDSLSR